MQALKEGGVLIAKIHQTAGRIFNGILRENEIQEINPAQGRILFALWKKDKIPISELADATQLGNSTLTSMLDRLEKAGYLKREPSTEDRRRILIKRTQKDKSLQKVYIKVSKQMEDIFYRGFSEKQIIEFELYLQKILGNLLAFQKEYS